MAKRKGGDRDARRRAQLERVAKASGGGEERRRREREAAARAAGAAPSAARWLVRDDEADRVVAVDVVATLAALDPDGGPGSRTDRAVTALARQVEPLVTAAARTPSGRTLLEVLVVDPDDRAAFEPAFDLESLLADRPVRDGGVDRALRLVPHLRVALSRHAAGDRDLHALVAPEEGGRHPAADAVDALCAVALQEDDDGVPGLVLDASSDPAVSVVPDGWIGRSTLELVLLAASGLAAGRDAAVVGAALAGAFQRWMDGADDAWRLAVLQRVPLDPADLLSEAARRAGSDHPSVLGGELAALVALRHPLA